MCNTEVITSIKRCFPSFDYIKQLSIDGTCEKPLNTTKATFYEAIETTTNRRVFIKGIIIQNDKNKEFEVESAFYKKHQNEGTIELLYEKVDEIETDNTTQKIGYFVFPYAEGGDLFEMIAEQDWTPTDEEMRRLAFNLLTSLNKIHSAGCIIRDIKLENLVYLDKHSPVNIDSIKFIDFGSCYINEISDKYHFKGTYYYYAPEYIYHNEVTSAMDIWSFGISLYTLIEHCFPTDSPTQLFEFDFIEQFEEENKEKLFSSERWSGISNDIKTLIKSMLTYDSKLRPSAKTLLKMRMFDTFRINLDSQLELYE